jgi:hypothetical protein
LKPIEIELTKNPDFRIEKHNLQKWFKKPGISRHRGDSFWVSLSRDIVARTGWKKATEEMAGIPYRRNVEFKPFRNSGKPGFEGGYPPFYRGNELNLY